MTLESIAQTGDNVSIKLPPRQLERPNPARRMPHRTLGSYTTDGTRSTLPADSVLASLGEFR